MGILTLLCSKFLLIFTLETFAVEYNHIVKIGVCKMTLISMQTPIS